MRKVINFKLKSTPSRQQAIQWLSQNYDKFPAIEDDLISTGRVFYNWRFIKGIDNIIYFANCIDYGITEYDLIEFKYANRTIPK